MIDIEALLNEAINEDLGTRFLSWVPPKPSEVVGTSLRFTTAKRKIKGLKVSETNEGYLLSAPQGLIRKASSLFRYIVADNGMVPLDFDDDLVGFEADDELTHRSSVPLWILKANHDGTIAISRIWEQ